MHFVIRFLPYKIEIFKKRVFSSLRNIQFTLESKAETIREFERCDFWFKDSEQALIIGHNFHPTPKSRDEFSDEDSATDLIPLPSALEPYFVAASKSAAHMPQLQHLRVAIWKPYSVTTLSWEMEFAAAGISSRFDDWESYALEGSTPHFQEQNLTGIDCVYWCVHGMDFPERVCSIWKERGLASNGLRVVKRRRSPRQSGLFGVATTNDDLLRMQRALLNG